MMQPRKLIWLTLVVFVMFLQGSARRAAASLQNQEGSFPVGHATRLLDVTGIRGEHRHVNVHLWYPAPAPQNCQIGNGNGQGCPPSVYTSRLNGIPLLPQWDPLSWTIGSTQAFEELPVSNAQSSWPVIIFSHGDQNNAIDYVYMLEALASKGYIVVAPDHVNDTQDDVRIDYIDPLAGSPIPFNFIDSPEGKPCFDDLPAPCEVLDRVKAQDPNNIDTQVACNNNLLIKTTASVRESMIDRVRDVKRIITDGLPSWFGDRADLSRVGVMGHSRGTVTALAAAGGSACWGISPVSGVKAVMGLAIGAQNVTLRVDLPNVKVPTQLMAGLLDPTRSVSKCVIGIIDPSCTAPPTLGSSDKGLVTIQEAKHRHFDSGLCAQTQSSGAIAQTAEAIVGVPSTTRAILDLQTVTNLLTPPPSGGGVAMDFCGFDTFTNPTYITDLVFQLTGLNVTPTNVPTVPPGATTGLTSDTVKDEVIQRAAAFFNCAFTNASCSVTAPQ